MTRRFFNRRSMVVLALALLAPTVFGLGASAAIADELAFGADGQLRVGPDGSPLRQSKLEKACGVSLARFCPELADSPGQTRSQAICLRPYGSSLPTYCRSAVSTALGKK